MKFRIFPPKSIKLIMITIFLLLLAALPVHAALWGNKTDINTEDFRRIVTELRIYDDPDLPYYNEIFKLYYAYYTGSEELLDALNKKIEITQQVMKILDADIKKEELGNLTYGRYILNAINEKELVEIGIKMGSPGQANGEYFSKLGKNLADWKSQLSKLLLTKIIVATCTAMGAPALSIGISTLGLFTDLSIIGTSINKLNEVWYEKAFWSYMQFRNEPNNYDHIGAWKPYAEPYVKYIIILSLEKQKKARKAIEENFESLWNKYGDHIVNNELDKNFKSQQRESLKILLLYALEAEPHPIITSPLKITPDPPYYVGDTINAEFTIANQGKLPINFSVLTVGGRDSDNQVVDFSHRQNIILKPFESYNYQGTLALNKVGDYHFFCAYQTPDGNWNTCVDLGSGLTDEDRTKEVVVIARESEDTPSVSLGYPEKILPVKPRIIGKPAPGYYISQILAKPDEIKIFGNYSKINNLEFLETIPIDVSGIFKTLSVKVPPALNEGLNIVEGETTLIEVTIQVKEVLVQKTLPDEEEVTEVSISENYYPLDEGRRWEYQILLKEGGGWYIGPESEISGKQIITNFPQRELEGKKVTPQQVEDKVWGSSRISFWFYIEDQSGVYEFAHQKPGQIEPKIAHDFIIKYPIKIGNSWQEIETSSFEPKISIPVESTIESINEVVTVPAGTFKVCLKIKAIGFAEKVVGKWLTEEEKVRIDREWYKWFAPGVGLIKMIFKEKKTCTGGIMSIPPPEFREITMQLKTFE